MTHVVLIGDDLRQKTVRLHDSWLALASSFRRRLNGYPVTRGAVRAAHQLRGPEPGARPLLFLDLPFLGCYQIQDEVLGHKSPVLALCVGELGKSSRI